MLPTPVPGADPNGPAWPGMAAGECKFVLLEFILKGDA